METIFYDVNSDQAFRDDQTAVANNNKPEFVFRTKRSFILQLLNSTSIDANGNYNDFYTGFIGVTITPTGAIDNNADHYFDGELNAGISGSISSFEIKGLTGTPRIVGTVKVTNGTGDFENINYNGFEVANGVYTFETADANFDPNPVTLTNTYSADDDARLKELPIIKIPFTEIDQTDKDTGKFIITVDSDTLIFQDLIEGSYSLGDDVEFEFQATDTEPRLIMAKKFGVKCLGLLDDNGDPGPAPKQDYWTIAETQSAINAQIGTRKPAVIDIVDPTAPPPTEISGDRYVLNETAGTVDPAWDGASQNDIVQFDGATWLSVTPEEGWILFVDLQNKDAIFVDDGTPAWELRPAIIEDHNDLNNIQGGTPGQYNHLTNAELTALGLNTAHRTGDGSDHANVALNDSHRTGSGADHADVALNNSHRSSTGNPHSTNINNLGSGTLAQLNSKVTDATLISQTEAEALAKKWALILG
jgi:hypothetical protein